MPAGGGGPVSTGAGRRDGGPLSAARSHVRRPGAGIRTEPEPEAEGGESAGGAVPAARCDAAEAARAPPGFATGGEPDRGREQFFRRGRDAHPGSAVRVAGLGPGGEMGGQLRREPAGVQYRLGSAGRDDRGDDPGKHGSHSGPRSGTAGAGVAGGPADLDRGPVRRPHGTANADGAAPFDGFRMGSAGAGGQQGAGGSGVLLPFHAPGGPGSDRGDRDGGRFAGPDAGAIARAGPGR